jgi:hypothetical protein
VRNDALATGALFVGGGVAGYALGRFVLARRSDARHAAPASAPSVQAHEAPMPARPHRAPRPSPVPSPTDVSPVSSPDQLDQVEMPKSAGLSRRFDMTFDKYRGGIPIEYLRALAQRESGMNADDATGPAWGLMQIVEVVRKDFNRTHGTHHPREDLLDAETSVAMCCWVLQTIIGQYARHHPDVSNLAADWDNPRFVELLTFGWNAGFSAAGGVIRVVSYLKSRGFTDITIDLVREHAQAAGAVRHLSNPRKVRWCKSVVRLYQQERATARA